VPQSHYKIDVANVSATVRAGLIEKKETKAATNEDFAAAEDENNQVEQIWIVCAGRVSSVRPVFLRLRLFQIRGEQRSIRQPYSCKVQGARLNFFGETHE